MFQYHKKERHRMKRKKERTYGRRNNYETEGKKRGT
jgi:hypothetical protein